MKLIRPPKTIVKLVFSNNAILTIFAPFEYKEACKMIRDGLTNKGIRELESLTDSKNPNLGAQVVIVDFDHVLTSEITEVTAELQIPREEKVIDAQGNVKTAITLEAPPSNEPQQ